MMIKKIRVIILTQMEGWKNLNMGLKIRKEGLVMAGKVGEDSMD